MGVSDTARPSCLVGRRKGEECRLRECPRGGGGQAFSSAYAHVQEHERRVKEEKK